MICVAFSVFSLGSVWPFREMFFLNLVYLSLGGVLSFGKCLHLGGALYFR